MVPRPRLVYVVTHATSARVLLRGQLSFFDREGYAVTLIAAPGVELDQVGRREGIRVISVPMQRVSSPVTDALALARMTRIFYELRPDIVNASTPKAGLLGMLAARAARVPIRIYLLRGLRLQTLSGLGKRVLAGTERLTSAAATDVISVSPSLQSAYLDGGYCAVRKIRVLGEGSSNGVDPTRFEPTRDRELGALALRAKLGIQPDTVVIGFMGRLVPDKGLNELVAAFERLGSRNVLLLVVGGDLAGDAVDPSFAAWAERQSRVICVPHVANPEEYHAVFDLLAFPSRREGFPNVPLEAAASGRPTVGFQVTGVTDAVVSGVTGMLVPPGDVEALSQALIRYVDDPELRRAHGQSARARARDLFASERVWRLWRDEYRRLLMANGVPVPQSPAPND